MKQYRLNRLLNASSNRCFDVAIDHGFFNELWMLSGLEDISKVVEVLVGAAPDAIQFTVGQARHIPKIPGRQKPSLDLRTDIANVYGRNVIQHKIPAAITRALMAVVHENATASDAAKHLKS